MFVPILLLGAFLVFAPVAKGDKVLTKDVIVESVKAGGDVQYGRLND